jgi:hypothetical protein
MSAVPPSRGEGRSAAIGLPEGMTLLRREQWTRQGNVMESLTPKPGIREQHRPTAVTWRDVDSIAHQAPINP